MANPKRPPSREVRRLREELRQLIDRWETVIQHGAVLEGELAQGLAQLRESRAAEMLKTIPVTQAEHPDGPIRTAALEKAGIHTMGEVLACTRDDLVEIPGFGETSADRIFSAAQRMLEAARQSARLQLGRDDPATLPILHTVYRALRERPLAAKAAEQAEQLRSQAKVLQQESQPASGFFRWLLASRSQQERATAAVEGIRALLESETARQLTRWEEETARAEAVGDEEVLREFQEQAAVYYTAVEEITGADLPTSSAHGALSDELIEAVEAFPLDTSRLTVTLRRYQRFGAQYALCQKRTLLGDEMGLGKTIEAIAVLAHLAAQGSKAFLIVCPAGVLINWCREIEKHSTVPVLRLYGDDREERCARWLTEGGAGVTTYETLQRLPLEGLEQLDLLIADEAHYVKNPEARRTIALTALAQKADRVLYLTGTPLENRVEEMCFLLSTLSPEIAAKAQELSDLAGAEPFRQAIAPVYLRRRREDVLTELPDLTEVEDWCEQTPSEAEAYRQAVQTGSFMAMRQAGWSSTDTGKALRLLELCREAEADDRRVLVFSFFRDTMAQVRRLLGDRCPSEIHGGVSPEERQRILDEFAHSPAGTALCCQVTAGGVGLNIQAASLVIFCEPQLKPSTETQAISRAYRMGQTRTVLVHRLLTEDTVDEAITELLHQKQALFDEYADRSAAGDAQAHSDAAWIARTVAKEQARLGLPPTPPQSR